jgi:acyl carrier protein
VSAQPQAPKRSWDDFAATVAGIARVPVEGVRRDTRLVGDLGLDSLALTEVIVALIVDFDMEALSTELEERDWGAVTIGSLYDEYLSIREPRERFRIERH